jgi:hypothetical protein
MGRREDYLTARDVALRLRAALSPGGHLRSNAEAASLLELLARTLGSTEELEYTAMMGAVRRAEELL